MKRGVKRGRIWLVSATITALLVGVVILLFALRGTGERVAGSSRYSETELGIQQIIDREYSLSQPWLQSPTSMAVLEQADQELERFYELRGHARERRYFEFQVELVISDALEALEGELDFYNGRLAQAFDETFDTCALAHGVPGGGATLSSLARDYVQVSGEPVLALGEEELAVLRYECAVEASLYPNLPPELREDLIEQTQHEIARQVSRWMASNPHLVVPIEYHPGANQPYADALIESCQQAPEPRVCAREAGVNLNGR